MGEQRAVGHPGLFGYRRRRRAQPLSDDHARRRCHQRVPLIFASWPRRADFPLISREPGSACKEPLQRFLG